MKIYDQNGNMGRVGLSIRTVITQLRPSGKTVAGAEPIIKNNLGKGENQ